MSELPTFEQLDRKDKTPIEKLLMMCLVTLTGHPNFVGYTEDKVYDVMVKWTKLIDW